MGPQREAVPIDVYRVDGTHIKEKDPTTPKDFFRSFSSLPPP